MANTASDFRVGDYRVWYDPPPIPTRNCDWHFQHKDDEGEAGRSGDGPSAQNCLEQIVELMAEELDTARGANRALRRLRDELQEANTAAPVREEGGALDDRLHNAISKLKDWVSLIQLRKNGGCVSGNPIVDCVNDLPVIIRELEAAELEIEGAFEALEDAALATREEGAAVRYRHKKRGTEYTLIGVGRAQGELQDDDPVVLYRGEDDGLWVRHQVEFCDGRFEEIPALANLQQEN